MDYSIRIGGEAGQGIQTIGDTLARVFARSGYHVFTHQDYESRIRGGHNYYQIRFSDKQITSSREGIDILVALDSESIRQYSSAIKEYGQIIFDSAAIGNPQSISQSSKYLDIPFVKIALEKGGNRIMSNTVATGAVLGMIGMDIDILIHIIKNTFKKKGEEIINANINSAMAGYDYAVKKCLKCTFSASPVTAPKMLLSGIDGIGLGALSAGCKFYSAYPMTPSTGIMNFLAENEKEYGIIVEQAEDEIAAINMAIGASFAGVRAMTGSSGGGFALMVEGLSLAAMTETPIVIALGQRPGPATGLPTRTEQADLNFALYTAHGEFPRVIFAPGSPEQAFHLTNKAFHIAEKYQMPVIVLFDTYLADTTWTYEILALDKIYYIDYRLRGDKLDSAEVYKRHAITEDGISPLAIPGASKHVVVTDSDEHDEEGHIIEDADMRIKMVKKRLFSKMPLIQKEISPPLLYGERYPDIIVAGWGSMYGIIKEAVDILSKNMSISMLHFSEIYPFPSSIDIDYMGALRNSKLTICIEQNATGQFARLMKAETGFEFSRKINRYDGRPFTVENLIGELHAVIG